MKRLAFTADLQGAPSSRRSGKLGVVLAIVLGAATCGAANAQSVVINEIHYHPFDATPDAEFVELYNPGAAPAALDAWTLSDGISHTFAAGTSIPAGGYLVVAKSTALLQAATGFAAAVQWASGSLSNGGERIVLSNASATIIDEVTFDDEGRWPTSPDGGGPSLELLHFEFANENASVWRASAGNYGTPGAQNSVFSSAPVVLIESPARQSVVAGMPTVAVTFAEPVTGVVAGLLTVNGSPATTRTGSGAGPYVFGGYAAPGPGAASVSISPGSVQDGSANAFAGDSWQCTIGAPPVVRINEIFYHPDEVADPLQVTEFLEFYNAEATAVDMSGWTMSSGVVLTFPGGTTIPAGGFLVIAVDPSSLQAVTGYAGAIMWTSGRLSNSGERVALSNNLGTLVDEVSFADAGEWSKDADGTGRSLELINPTMPNDYGAAWRPSVPIHGTPGAANSVFQANPEPIITAASHSPPIPQPGAPLTVTALVLTNGPTPSASVHFRQDQNPTIAYSSQAMLDNGLNGDGAAGDGVFGAVLAGLPDGQRLDFYLTATDGVTTATAPGAHAVPDTLGNPSATFLCKFSGLAPLVDFPQYHLIITEANRAAQEDTEPAKTPYDATFIDETGKIYYNVSERYRGSSSLTQFPHSYRIDFSAQNPMMAAIGYEVTKLQLVGREAARQRVGYESFDAAGLIAPDRAFVRLNVNPTNDAGGLNEAVYTNVERVDEDFIDRRFTSGTAGGNLYRGRDDADLRWEGPTVDPGLYGGPYRLADDDVLGYEKVTNDTIDDWDDLITLCDALTCAADGGLICGSGGAYDASWVADVNSLIDEDQWCRWFAVHMILGNREGGIYRNIGDDYYLYFNPQPAADYPALADYDAVMFPWDLDSVMLTSNPGPNETIWRTTVPVVQRLLHHNAYAPIFVKNVRDLLDNELSIANWHARIDALPTQVASPAFKQILKDWATARHAAINAEIVSALTLNGVPSSPYAGPDPVLHLSGTLNQAGTHAIRVNGADATFSVFNGTWSYDLTLTPGANPIVLQALGRQGQEIGRIEQAVLFDLCPSDPAKLAPGACGCGTPDTDSDGDGTPNCIDGCPLDPSKVAAGVCGCGTPDTDSDGDSTPDCNDGCPLDPSKILAGVCGCGTPDTDSDGDGTPNCNDGCPLDPSKVAAGVCGCGVSDADSDGDGVANCNDGCPSDPNKTSPGLCGCGAPETCGNACTDASAILVGSTPFSNAGAATDGPAHPCIAGDGQIHNDIWRVFTATAPGTVTVSLCGSSFDARMAVYDDSACDNFEQRLIVCGDDDCGNDPELSFRVVQGRAYQIRLGAAAAGMTGSGTIVLSFAESAGEALYAGFVSSTTVPGVGTVENEDLVRYDAAAGSWSMYFDGSDVGLGSAAIDGFALLPNGDLLLSVNADVSLPGLIGGPNGALVDDADIVRFVPASTGPDTAGTLEFYFDGSDVGLSPADGAADIDAIDVDESGNLLVSTLGTVTVLGPSALDEDILKFVPTSTGELTAGAWSMYFDGSDVGLSTTADEDIDAVDVLASGDILLSTLGPFAVPGLSGSDDDVMLFHPSSIGAVTSGVYSPYASLVSLGISPAANLGALEVTDAAADNDDCSEPVVLSAPSTPIDTTLATTAGPPHGCLSGTGEIYADRWFTYLATSTGQVEASICDAGFDTRLAAYSGDGCDDLAARLIGCDDDGCVTGSRLVFDATSGNTYLIRVGGAGAAARGVGTLRVGPLSSVDSAYAMSFTTTTTIPGLGTFPNEDILLYDPATSVWSQFFDGSDVGLGPLTIDGIAITPEGDILLSFTTDANVPGLVGGPSGTLVDDADIVKFTPTSLGPITSGTISFYFDGSDVGLDETNNSEDVDAIALDASGNLILSMLGSTNAVSPTALDEDLLRFTATGLGAATSGAWSVYFDGSDVGFSATDEDLDAVEILPGGDLLLSTIGVYSVPGSAGSDDDIIEFVPTSLGPTTSGTASLFAALTSLGIDPSENLNALDVTTSSVGGLGLAVSARLPKPACPADYNRDDALDDDDMFEFLSDFFSDGADFDGNGLTDSADYAGFIAAFAAGCP